MLAELVGQPGWTTDPRFADRQGWVDHLDDVIRPAVEAWAADKTRLEACAAMSAAGIAAGPCFRDDEVVADPHVAARNMLVEVPRTDGVDEPVLVPGNPVKLTNVAEGPETAGALAGRAHRRRPGRGARARRRRPGGSAGRRRHRLRGT